MSRTVGLQKRCVFTSVRFWPFRPLVDYTIMQYYTESWFYKTCKKTYHLRVAGTYFFTPRIDGLHRPPAGLPPACWDAEMLRFELWTMIWVCPSSVILFYHGTVPATLKQISSDQTYDQRSMFFKGTHLDGATPSSYGAKLQVHSCGTGPRPSPPFLLLLLC